MKKTVLNSVAKKVFAGSILAATLFFASQNAAIANNSITYAKTEKALSENASIKYVGSNDDNLLFNVQFNNVNNEKFTLLVSDENGETMYSVFSKDKNFTKTFALPKSLDLNKINFTIRTNEGTYRQSFSINIATIETEDVVVSKK